MQYLRKEPFTIPANNGRTSQRDWDRATMTPEEFARKYQETTTHGDRNSSH